MPTPWTTLTGAMLDDAKAAALVAALRTAALGPTQADPVPGILADVVVRIRMEIAAGGRTRLSADATLIPPSLKRLALRMTLREGQSRLNALGALALSEDERIEEKNDLRFLERIAKGEISVEEPTDPEAVPTVQSSSPSPMICARPRGVDQDGT